MEIEANNSVYFSRLPILAKEKKKKKEDRIMYLGFLATKIWKEVPSSFEPL